MPLKSVSSIEVEGSVKSTQQGSLIGSFSTMPTASASFNGLIVLYTGETAGGYNKDAFYICANGAWAEITEIGKVKSVNDQTGDVVLDKSDVGLGNVDNTSDINKPVSTATQDALDTKQATVTGAASSITSNNLTANRALISDGNGKVAVSPISNTELGYLDNATGNIQSQLDNKPDSADLADVATSGSYNDLTDKPTIPVVPDNIESTLNKSTSFPATFADDTKYPSSKSVQDFVNSSVQTATSYFDGAWNTWALVPSTVEGFTDAGLQPPGPNNYLTVYNDENHSNETWRYKYARTASQTYDKSGWNAEYRVNESPLTAAQIAALNSGITAGKVAIYDGYQAQINGKVDKITTANRLYSVNSSGVQASLPYGTGKSQANAIPQRNASGEILVPTPSSSDAATPKTYVDTALQGKQNTLTAGFGIAIENNVIYTSGRLFIAMYDSTPYHVIFSAFMEGMNVMVDMYDALYPCVMCDEMEIHFQGPTTYTGEIMDIYVSNYDVWDSSTISLQDAAYFDKASISSTTSQDLYPSDKAVVDYVAGQMAKVRPLHKTDIRTWSQNNLSTITAGGSGDPDGPCYFFTNGVDSWPDAIWVEYSANVTDTPGREGILIDLRAHKTASDGEQLPVEWLTWYDGTYVYLLPIFIGVVNNLGMTKLAIKGSKYTSSKFYVHNLRWQLSSTSQSLQNSCTIFKKSETGTGIRIFNGMI